MQPNVLLLVWDACRLDAAREHAPTLRALAEDNLWFENAVTPVGQSLGAHVSMFTGQYAHEHGTFVQTDAVEEPLALVEAFSDAGYYTVGASGNGFASAKYGFDRGFDEFYNTQGVVAAPEGLDPHAYARELREERGEFDAADVDKLDLLRSALGHEHPLGSIANVATAALSELGARYEWLRAIPHPRFDRYNEFCFDPADNTRLLATVFERTAATDEPFFAFANYMDPHHPYAPPAEYQREYCGRTLGYRELSDLADQTLPWHYLERLEEDGQLDDETLETVRNLYHGEVRSADEHLARLLEELERTGLREDTIVVVVADHGENLGEENWMGERHFGHVRSASEHHLRVPMVVAHPEIEGRSIEEYVSLKDVYALLAEGREALLESAGRDVDVLLPEDGVVTAAVPRATPVSVADRFDEQRAIVARTLVAAYGDDWKVVASTNGETRAWADGEARDAGAAPEHVVDAAESGLADLLEAAGRERGSAIGEAETAQLEALGYL